MTDVRVAIIGAGEPETGEDPANASHAGYSVAYRHAPCYLELDACELVGCADIDPGRARAFADAFGLPPQHAYEDYREMIADLDLDLVDVCTPAPTHAEIVIDCAGRGLQGIHCEKPMARTWGECRRMANACADAGVQLTFNHQRRFGTPWREAKRLLDAGEIGDFRRIETGVGPMYSMGTHALDLCGFLNDENAAAWVLGAVDFRDVEIFSSGAHNENQAIAQWEYENGVHGLAATGHGSGLVDAFHRLVGSDGVIEVAPSYRAPVDSPADLRIRRADDVEWESRSFEGSTGGLSNGYPYMIRAIGEVVSALVEGRESELGAHNALQSTEIIFSIYESARRRGRVDLPLDVDDNPLEGMIDS